MHLLAPSSANLSHDTNTAQHNVLFPSVMPPPRNSHFPPTHPPASRTVPTTLSQPWQLPPTTPPTRLRSEILSKASGAIFALLSLLVVWTLSLLFATRLSHLNLAGFNILLVLQFILWSLLRQGFSIIALVIFDLYYTCPRRSSNKRPSLNLYTLDAWMSLIITPINILRGRLLNVLLVLLPVTFSVFATYATSGLLGRQSAFTLVDTGVKDKVNVGPAGGGRTHAYVMTGMEFIYNASNGALARPNNRFVFVLAHDKILVPSIPNIGTYFLRFGPTDKQHRAVRIRKVPSVLATISVRVEKNRDITPSSDEKYTTVGKLGDVYYEADDTNNGTSIVRVSIVLLNAGVHRQIYLDIAYKTVLSDLVFATFNNGSHINSVEKVEPVSEIIPERLRGDNNFTMENVLDNFILSQNGEIFSQVFQPTDPDVTNLGLLLAGAYGIRSAAEQNWLDGDGEFDVDVLLEREFVLVPVRYWAIAGVMSAFLVIACLMTMFRRPTINGNLVQVVSLLQRFIQECPGACTPNWQVAYVKNRTFMEDFMHKRIVLGYMASESGEVGAREVFETHTSDGRRLTSHHIAFDSEDRVTRDKLNVLYKLLAGTCAPRIKRS